ncbi:3025_t:CDS:1, partial [Gigaspora margarita]
MRKNQNIARNQKFTRMDLARRWDNVCARELPKVGELKNWY